LTRVGAHVELRALRLDDAPFVLRLLNEPSFVDNIGDRGVRTLDDAREYLHGGPLASMVAHGHALELVCLREGPPIGLCGLVRRAGLELPDLGYALLPEFTGRGYAREAAALSLAWGHGELGLARILAIVKPTNARSIRLLDSLGFRAIGSVALQPERPPDRLFEHLSGRAAA
jgi:RimJ/RimL family protein N-acetyltransferase